ncbi:MAG TPA: polynucleotide adenylyltransferase PcnB [Gammaproteobacteria bacterium]|nr:polynucleotide adenylyltransferase PcnB [Gammaproteobacteria bacterium]
MLTNIRNWFCSIREKRDRSRQNQTTPQNPVIIPRSAHCVSRANISKHALKVLYRLHDAGYQAYLVGGGVRDVLLDSHPKDFDVATNARPEEIQNLFRNCRLIGRRFRLAHVHFGYHIIEVATFRANSDDKALSPHLVHSEEGMILRDNIYGMLIDDVYRRDFTVNALYYNIADFTLLDYVGGLKDLKARCLRMIGEPSQRYREDPVRMLRAIRFAAKLGFSIHPDSEKPLFELGALVKQVPSARLLDEFMKMFLSGFAEVSFRLLRHYGLFIVLFPQAEQCLMKEQGAIAKSFITGALLASDQRVHESKPVALPFLLGAFLWYPVQARAMVLMKEGVSEFTAFYEACDWVLQEQQQSVVISKRFSQAIREIWILQIRLIRRLRKRVSELVLHPRFRAAYDFLLLRASTGDKSVEEVAAWWKTYIEANNDTRGLMEKALQEASHTHRSKRRKRR